MPRPLNRRRHHSLVAGAIAGNPARHNLAPLVNKPLQKPVIMIADDIDLILTETAYTPSSSVKFHHFILPQSCLIFPNSNRSWLPKPPESPA
jgi:hypothetical protein